MSFPFMPWYHGDHLKDARRLNHEQNWAYFLLINEYWSNGTLIDNDQELAAIAGLSLAKWRKIRPAIEPFFYDRTGGRWHHKRIDAELAKAHAKSHTNSERARKAAAKRWA